LHAQLWTNVLLWAIRRHHLKNKPQKSIMDSAVIQEHAMTLQ
jgi:hypothetical protein